MTETLSTAVWPPNTNVRLTNVPWDTNYVNVVEYASDGELDAYLASRPGRNVEINKLVYLRSGEPVDLSIPFNEAQRFNYISVRNGLQPIQGDYVKTLYYFILGVEYISASVTRFVIGLDEYQTHRRKLSFGNCYIDRGHVGIANRNAMNNRGSDYLTEPEGLDMGAEYSTVAQDRNPIMGVQRGYDYMVTSTTSLVKSPGTTQEPLTPSAIGCYIAPFNTATESYIVRGQDLMLYLEAMSVLPWITAGIISIVMVPNNSWFGTTAYKPVRRVNSYPPGRGADSYLNEVTGSGIYNEYKFLKQYTDFQVTQFKNKLPQRYRHLDKFTVSPYSMIELTTYSGVPVYYKPEKFRQDIELSLYRNVSLIPGNERFEFSLAWYNMLPTGTNQPHDTYCVFDQFPKVPVLNNGALLAQAQSARGTQSAYDSAAWGLERAQAGNSAAFDMATASMNASNEQYRLDREMDARNTHYDNMQGYTQAAMGGGIGMAMGGSPAAGAVGAAAGAASAGMNNYMNNKRLSLRNEGAARGQAISQGLSETVRDTNYALSDFSSRGDYANTIAGLNAQTENLQMTPAFLSGQYGGNFTGMNRDIVLDVNFKMISSGAVRRIGEFWLRYGYKVALFFKPTKLNLMKHFTYWKMQEVNLYGEVNEFHKSVIKGIFEKGVTVWRNADDIGAIDNGSNTVQERVAL